MNKDFKISRDTLMTRLKEKGIDTRPFFYPISQLPMFKTELEFPVSYEISSRGINLPSGVSLTEKDIQWISKEILTFLKNI